MECNMSEVKSGILRALLYILQIIQAPIYYAGQYLFTRLQSEPNSPSRLRDLKKAKQYFYAGKIIKALPVFTRILVSDILHFLDPNFRQKYKEPYFYFCMSLNFLTVAATDTYFLELPLMRRMRYDFLTPVEARHFAKLTYGISDFDLSLKFYRHYQRNYNDLTRKEKFYALHSMVETRQLELIPEALASQKIVADLEYLLETSENTIYWLFARFHIIKRLAQLSPFQYFDTYALFLLEDLKMAKRCEILPLLEEAQDLHDEKLACNDSKMYLELLLELENIYIQLGKRTKSLFVYESLISRMDVPVVSSVLALEIASKRMGLNQPRKAIDFLVKVLKHATRKEDIMAMLARLGGKYSSGSGVAQDRIYFNSFLEAFMSDGNAKKARSKFIQVIAMISVTNCITQREQDWSPLLHCYKCETEIRLGLMSDANASWALAADCFHYTNAKFPYVIPYVCYLRGMMSRIEGKIENALKMMNRARKRSAKLKITFCFGQSRNYLHFAGLHYDIGNLERALAIWSRFFARLFKIHSEYEERIIFINTSLDNMFLFSKDKDAFLTHGSDIIKKVSRPFAQDFALYRNSKYLSNISKLFA